MTNRLVIVLLCSVLLSATGCQTVRQGGPDFYFASKGLPSPVLNDIPHCRDYGCATIDHIALLPAEWESIAALFPAQRDAARERSAIAQAIGRFEEIVGARNGTSADKSGTFAGTGKTGQHDCIDESTNTTMYLTLLEKEGILRFHGVSGPLSRTPFTTLGQGKLWPHQTAVIREIADGKSYAVDSWFHDNGHPAEIVPLATWRAGWAPGD